MKMFLLSLMLMSVIVFAEVHPALKEAVDSQNYKQAENLVKNVGIKDVYCPATLSAKDADKIYGKVFSDSIGFLLENCDSDFSKTYLEYKCAGGNDKKMCLNLINLTNPNYWPESYAQKFCTKKNVEICAAAVERIPIEKSVPYLKAIRANKLADMSVVNIKNLRSGNMTKSECYSMGQDLYNNKLAEIEREIDKANSNWRNARTSDNRYFYRKKIRYWEDVKRGFESVGLSGLCSGYQNEASFEKFKLNQYYFEIPFMLLTHRAAQYYWNIHNPIIPGLADNWSDVDRVFEITNSATIKSIESVKDSLAKLKALSEYMEKFKLAPYFIYKRNIIDDMKSSFAKNEKIDEVEQLFYCKLYPSLDKELEKILGIKTINCKSLLEANKKIEETCEDGAELFEGKVVCENGVYEKKHWVKIQNFFVINDYDYQMSSENAEDLFGMLNFIKHGRLYSWSAGMSACPDGYRNPKKTEMEVIVKYGRNLIKPSKAGYIDEYGLHQYEKETIYMTSSRYGHFGSGDFFNAAVVNSDGEWYLDGFRMFRETAYADVKQAEKMLVSVLCISEEQENQKCSENQEGICYVNNCCENGVFKKKMMESMVDSRDGMEYKTVRFGTQTWMAENLNYELENSYCYNNSIDSCSKYGRLYTWKTALKACPSGWRLPSKAEFEMLFTAVGGDTTTAGKMLKSNSDWNEHGNGSVAYGFSALPSGYNDYNKNEFGGNGNYALFWSSTEYDENSAYSMSLSYRSADTFLPSNGKDNGFSVRCIKDENMIESNENNVTFEYGKNLPEVSFYDDGSSAAASFFAGEKIMEKIKQYGISGNANEKNAKIKEMTSLIQTGALFYEKATDDEKWYYPAKLQSGKLFIVMADQIKNQESNAKDEEEKFAENIVNSQKLPKYYDQAKNFFQRAIIHARVKGVTNEYVKALEEYYINMFFKSCSVFRQVQTDYLTSPLPDSASIVREYFRQGLSRCEDATKAAHEDLEKYREELFNRADQAKQKAVSQCAEGLKATKTYGIKTDQVDVLYDLLQELQK